MLLTKTDLLPVLQDFEPERATDFFRRLANPAPVLSLAAKTGSGMPDWIAWLRTTYTNHRQHLSKTADTQPELHQNISLGTTI